MARSTSRPTPPAKIAAVVGLGHYRLDLRDDDPTDAQTSVSFDVGWSGEAKAETPDLLDVTLDKPAYASGDTDQAENHSRTDAKATLAIVGDGVKKTVQADLSKGDNEIAVPVEAGWGVGAYALVVAHRPLDKAANRMPGRALGLAYFAIDPAAHRLDIALNAPPKAHAARKAASADPDQRPDGRRRGLCHGGGGRYRHPQPDPLPDARSARVFLRPARARPPRSAIIYGLLIDGLQGARGQIRSGGDGGGPETSAEKPSQEPLALYSGIVRVGPDGKAEVAFDLPAFNGTVRVTAVAWSKGRTGSACADVIVRDPVVAQASLPRFLALGDQSRLNLRLDNVEGAAGDYKLSLDLHGPIAAEPADLHRIVKLGRRRQRQRQYSAARHRRRRGAGRCCA